MDLTRKKGEKDKIQTTRKRGSGGVVYDLT